MLLLIGLLATVAPGALAIYPIDNSRIEVAHLTRDWPEVPFKSLGGFSPWFPSTNVYGIDGIEAPDGCVVNQVQMYMRHAERLGSGGTHRGLVALAAKLANASYAFETEDPSLAYLQSWNWTVPAEYLSPFGGVEAMAAGASFQSRYGHLLPENAFYNNSADVVPVRSTDQQRVNMTANNFVAGFLGQNWKEQSSWTVLPDSSTTFNSTLSTSNCPASSTVTLTANGIFNAYLQPLIVDRLSPMMEGFNLTTDDVAAMMNACPFDSFVLGKPSPLCSIFTAPEWKGYNYAYDLNQFGNAGYGGPLGTVWGVSWAVEMLARLNNTVPRQVADVNSTLDSDPKTFPLDAPVMLDFGHDSSLQSIITALGLLKADYGGNVTLEQIDDHRLWQSSLIAPMGGRLYVERLECPQWGSSPFVRLLLNDAVVPLNGLEPCATGDEAEHGLCELSAFLASQRTVLEGSDWNNCYKNYTGVAL